MYYYKKYNIPLDIFSLWWYYINNIDISTPVLRVYYTRATRDGTVATILLPPTAVKFDTKKSEVFV